MKESETSIREVVEADLCLGCGACAAGIEDRQAMALSAEGFLRPISATTLARRDASDVCPGLSLTHEAASVAATHHPLWGPLHDVRTGFATDADVRHKGSSGGALSAICIGLVESGVVDFVWHTRADPDDPIGNA